MHGRSGTIRWLIAGALCLGIASGASADIVVKAGTTWTATPITITPGSLIDQGAVNPGCADCNPVLPANTYNDGVNDGKVTWTPVSGAPGNGFTFYVHDKDGPFQHRTYASAVNALNRNQMTAIGVGEGSSAGGLHGSLAIPDTAFASIGLYGGPPDSMMIAIIDRNTPGQVGITFSNSAALQVRAAISSHEQPKATYKVFVFENDAAADADVNHTGAGAKFSGTVILDGSSGTLQTRGGFNSSDWFLVNQGAGKYVARPSPGLQKIVLVANSANAALVGVGDPAMVQATPGVSPVVLILLALALAATGMVALRKRTGPTLA